MLPTLEIVGSAFLFNPHGALFGPGDPCCICVSSPILGSSPFLIRWTHLIVLMASERCHGIKSWAQSSWFSSSPLCLRVKNPSWREIGKDTIFCTCSEKMCKCEMYYENTFHNMKMIRASSSKPPIMLPIKIQSEMGIARPLRTSSTVYRKTDDGRN